MERTGRPRNPLIDDAVLDATVEVLSEVGYARLTTQAIRAAAEAAVHGARPREDNAFKVELVKRTVVRALMDLEGTP